MPAPIDSGFAARVCPKCGTQAIAFICDTPGCPVNGGAAYGVAPEPAPQPKIDSGFAILDVKKGRAKLAKRFAQNKDLRIPVVIRGRIYDQHSRDDGVSIEFGVLVDSAEEVVSEVAAPKPIVTAVNAHEDLCAALEDLVIGIGMGWELDGFVEAARAALAKANPDSGGK